MSYEEYLLAGRNAVLEALRAGKPIDKIYILDGRQESTRPDDRPGGKEDRRSSEFCRKRTSGSAYKGTSSGRSRNGCGL